jgi:hypothetical protein
MADKKPVCGCGCGLKKGAPQSPPDQQKSQEATGGK